MFGWFGGNEVHCSTGRVLTKQRALRTFQDLKSVQVEGGACCHRGIGQGDLVHINADGRCYCHGDILEADAANGIDRRAVVARLVGKAGDEFGQVRHRHNALLLELLGSDRGDRHRYVAGPLGALLRGDDDFLKLSALLLGTGA